VKYQEEIEPDDTRTSHGLVVRLIGSHKRVLDVGCANGQLAEFLQRQGNEVSGVELDPELAEMAKSRVGTVLVGDVEQLDLVAEFGEASVDVVVFADVLEHLKNPLAALRQARQLLTEGGYVVASIPNIAHGAARLALLQGNFEYRELGLLDDTHLRFFTRSTVDSLFRSAGFVVMEWQQTTAGPFETEIPLFPSEFASETLEQVDRDPDSQTYQFVVRAVPIGNGAGDQLLAAELVAKGRELEFLRSQLAAIARSLSGVPRPPSVGLLEAADPSEPGVVVRLRTAVVTAELRRRLAGFAVRVYGVYPDPVETGLAGEAAVPLLPWDAERSDQLRAEADAVVALASTFAPPGLQSILDGLEQDDCPLYRVIPDAPWWSSTSQPGGLATHFSSGEAGFARRIVDPLMLIGRLVTTEFLLQRADYLSLLGILPETTGFVLAYLPDVEAGTPARAKAALEAVSRRAGTALVGLDGAEALGPSSGPTLASADLTPIDLLAVVAASGLVVTGSPAMLALATGLSRPALGVARDGSEPGWSAAWEPKDQRVARVEELVALAAVATAGTDVDRRRDEGVSCLDLFFDDLAGELLSAGARPVSASAPQRLSALTEQVRTLESVNAGLRARLTQERSVIAGLLGPGPHQEWSGRSQAAPGSGPERALWGLNPSQAEINRLQKEIAAIYATRTMRVLQPARRLYGRLRTLRR
jgi:2-polyprenyl-3-methyl-5-hydroxy-6-metoxy-1,4-benzoquinol methylase